jgi:hypothetical protein
MTVEATLFRARDELRARAAEHGLSAYSYMRMRDEPR